MRGPSLLLLQKKRCEAKKGCRSSISATTKQYEEYEDRG